jgi:hypothetical protein
MTSTEHSGERLAIKQDAAEQMAKYGITRVPKDYFLYKEYRYTNLDDAIAQAKRQHLAVPSNGREQPAPG